MLCFIAEDFRIMTQMSEIYLLGSAIYIYFAVLRFGMKVMKSILRRKCVSTWIGTILQTTMWTWTVL